MSRDRTGEIVLATPSMQLLEILVCGELLDVALAEKLDMEGGRTGRHVQFRPSLLVQPS